MQDLSKTEENSLLTQSAVNGPQIIQSKLTVLISPIIGPNSWRNMVQPLFKKLETNLLICKVFDLSIQQLLGDVVTGLCTNRTDVCL